jgi:hypothetical protein
MFELPVAFVVTSKLPREQTTQRFQVQVFVANGDDTTNRVINSVQTANCQFCVALEAFGRRFKLRIRSSASNTGNSQIRLRTLVARICYEQSNNKQLNAPNSGRRTPAFTEMRVQT